MSITNLIPKEKHLDGIEETGRMKAEIDGNLENYNATFFVKKLCKKKPVKSTTDVIFVSNNQGRLEIIDEWNEGRNGRKKMGMKARG